MDVFSTFSVTLKGGAHIVDQAAGFFNQYDLKFEECEEENKYRVEECTELVYVDDFCDLIVELVSECPKVGITIEGTTDCNGNELQNFKISYSNHKMTIKTSWWYCPIEMDEFDDYESFCEEFDQEDDVHLISRKRFEKYKENGICYSYEDDNSIVAKVTYRETETREIE